MTVLERICAEKRLEIARRRLARPLREIKAALAEASPPRGFARRLQAAASGGGYGLIAEIKRASPSRGLIRADFDPVALARAYEAGGAACLSVLTDEPFFQGKDSDLAAARRTVALPVLRKDFMLDSYQVHEARALGADCILLIMAALDDGAAAELAKLSGELGMDVLVEIHDADELGRALSLPCQLIGINARNLKDLTVDPATATRLAPLIPHDRIAVAESGIRGAGDLARLARLGVRCFLVGEHLMSQPDVEAATRSLLSPMSEPVAARG